MTPSGQYTVIRGRRPKSMPLRTKPLRIRVSEDEAPEIAATVSFAENDKPPNQCGVRADDAPEGAALGPIMESHKPSHPGGARKEDASISCFAESGEPLYTDGILDDKAPEDTALDQAKTAKETSAAVILTMDSESTKGQSEYRFPEDNIRDLIVAEEESAPKGTNGAVFDHEALKDDILDLVATDQDGTNQEDTLSEKALSTKRNKPAKKSRSKRNKLKNRGHFLRNMGYVAMGLVGVGLVGALVWSWKGNSNDPHSPTP